MQVETKFLRLCQPIALGEQINGWRVCWLGGWAKDRLFFYVMVAKMESKPKPAITVVNRSGSREYQKAGRGRVR